MKKALLSLLLASSLSVFAQDKEEDQKPQMKKIEMPILCMDSKVAADLLAKTKETLFFVGLDRIQNAENLTLSVFKNQDSLTYSVMFVSTQNNLVCVLSAGENARIMYKDQ